MKSFKTPKGTELQILSLKGKDYLQVAQRLVWFREERQTWSIETEFLKLEDKFAIARAVIRNETGIPMATAHKREDAAHFPDFMEKAETGSIGRALALCGYGTQFTADELDEGARIVDSPINPKHSAGSSPTAAKSTQSVEPVNSTGSTDWEGFPDKLLDAHNANPSPSSDQSVSNYRVPFGKTYKGMTLEEMGLDKVVSFSLYLQESAAKENKEMNQQAAQFCHMADAFIKIKKGVTR